MTTFESEICHSKRSDSELYEILTDFKRIENALPQGNISNWRASADSCRFTVEGLGEVGLKRVSSVPNSEVKFQGNGKIPFDFYLIVNLKQSSSSQTDVQVRIDASLNPLMKMMASGPIEKFINTLAASVAAC